MNPRGEPFGFIRVTNVRKPTIRLDLRAYHDPPQHHATRYADAIPILSLQSRAEHFASPDRPGLFTSKRI